MVALTTGTNSHPEYTYQKGVIRHKDRILVGSGSDLRKNLISCFHDTCWGGHSGIQGTYQRMKPFFYWPNMRKDIEVHVQKCDICCRSKSENCPYPGLLQPLAIPDQAWQHISMDFIEGLPKSLGSNAIYVVVDRLTKYAHFIPISLHC